MKNRYWSNLVMFIDAAKLTKKYIVFLSGTISTRVGLDYEHKSVYNLQVQASDGQYVSANINTLELVFLHVLL